MHTWSLACRFRGWSFLPSAKVRKEVKEVPWHNHARSGQGHSGTSSQASSSGAVGTVTCELPGVGRPRSLPEALPCCWLRGPCYRRRRRVALPGIWHLKILLSRSRSPNLGPWGRRRCGLGSQAAAVLGGGRQNLGRDVQRLGFSSLWAELPWSVGRCRLGDGGGERKAQPLLELPEQMGMTHLPGLEAPGIATWGRGNVSLIGPVFAFYT